MKWWRRRKPNRLRTAEEPRRSGRMLASIAVLAVVAMAIAYVVDYLERIEWERFRTLEITGELEHVTAADVKNALAAQLEQGFAAIDMTAAREAVEALPWVADAAVRRQWPGTLVVELVEERPVATWFGTSLMNEMGEVFIDGAAGYSGVLPDVGGPRGTQREMIERLAEMQAQAKAAGLGLRRLLRTDRRAERFWLENGVEVRLGRRDVDARLRRFLETAWPALRTRTEEIEYIDMRYTNGFAVGWKTAAGDRANVQENG